MDFLQNVRADFQLIYLRGCAKWLGGNVCSTQPPVSIKSEGVSPVTNDTKLAPNRPGRKPVSEFTAEVAHAFLTYDPDTGLFHRRKTAGSAPAGSFVGRIHSAGHMEIRVAGFKFIAGRLAWLMTYGQWPDQAIRYLDGSSMNTRIANMEAARWADVPL